MEIKVIRNDNSLNYTANQYLNKMKTITNFFGVALFGLFALISIVFPITATILHFWTTYIAYTESGFFAALVTLIIPVLSEVYWMFKMFGENNVYAWVALLHFILALPVSAARSRRV